MRRFLALAIPGLVAGGIPQLLLIAASMVASLTPNAISWLYYANRLVELPLGVVSIAIGTVLVPAFARAVRENDREALIAAESRGLELSFGLALPAAVALVVLASPIVAVLFERGAFTAADTAATAAALGAFALGLPGHVLTKAFSPAFFAREDTQTPMRAALIGLAVAIAGSLLLDRLLGHLGIALATALAGWVSAGLLARSIRRGIGFALDQAARRRLPRIVLAAAGMGVVLGITLLLVDIGRLSTGGRVVVLGGLVALGLGSYVALLQALGVVRAKALLQALRRRL
jgi:putative peptidoglycan lipid II flippase